MFGMPPAPGQFVTVDGHRVHVQSQGAGTPIVLESGAGTWSSHWHQVMQHADKNWRLISYDRAGLGWSDARAGKRDTLTLMQELLGVLDVLQVNEPVILVAHSYGASIARLFAALHPQRVQTIVFVDGWHESFEQWERDNVPPVNTDDWLSKSLDWFALHGGLRLLNAVLPTPKPPWPIPASVWQAMLAISSRGEFLRATQREADGYAEGDRALRAQEKLPHPCMALVAKQSMAADSAPEGYPIEAHNLAWQHASAKLAEVSVQGQCQLLDNPDHMVPLQQPEMVIAAIRQLLQQTANDVGFESDAQLASNSQS